MEENSEGNSVSTPKRKHILSKGDLSKVLWDADVMSLWDIGASWTCTKEQSWTTSELGLTIQTPGVEQKGRRVSVHKTLKACYFVN